MDWLLVRRIWETNMTYFPGQKSGTQRTTALGKRGLGGNGRCQSFRCWFWFVWGHGQHKMKGCAFAVLTMEPDTAVLFLNQRFCNKKP